MKLILASGSPYRRELLARLRIPFDVLAPDIDESPRPEEAPAALARRLARAKADAIAGASPGQRRDRLRPGGDAGRSLADRQAGHAREPPAGS